MFLKKSINEHNQDFRETFLIKPTYYIKDKIQQISKKTKPITKLVKPVQININMYIQKYIQRYIKRYMYLNFNKYFILLLVVYSFISFLYSRHNLFKLLILEHNSYNLFIICNICLIIIFSLFSYIVIANNNLHNLLLINLMFWLVYFIYNVNEFILDFIDIHKNNIILYNLNLLIILFVVTLFSFMQNINYLIFLSMVYPISEIILGKIFHNNGSIYNCYLILISLFIIFCFLLFQCFTIKYFWLTIIIYLFAIFILKIYNILNKELKIIKTV